MRLVLVVFMLHIYMCKLDHDGNVFFHCDLCLKKRKLTSYWYRWQHGLEKGIALKGVKGQLCGSQL